MSKARTQARNTRQLEVVWNAVKDDKSHPTADQIYDKVRKQLPNISLGTVYRNLQKLVADEKLQILILGRSQHFDPLVGRHQHFICELCDSVFDVIVDTEKISSRSNCRMKGSKSPRISWPFTAPASTARRERSCDCSFLVNSSVAAINSALIRWLTWLMYTFRLIRSGA